MPDTLPLKPIDQDTADKITAAVGERAAIAEAIAPVVRSGLRNVYFVGAGGSIICSYPAHYVLQQRGSVPAFQLQSDELNSSVPALMGPGSLVVLASYTGKTKETVQAAKTAKQAGATVIAAAKAGSPLAEAADVAFSGKSDVFELLVAYAVLEATGADLDPTAVSSMLEALPARGTERRHRVRVAPGRHRERVQGRADHLRPRLRTLLRLGVRPGHVLPAGDAVEARRVVQHR